MGFREGAYMNIFNVWPQSAKFTKASGTISVKNDDGSYETQFRGYVAFLGEETAKKASQLDLSNKYARIKLGKVDVRQKYDGDGRDAVLKYENFNIYSFDVVNNTPNHTAPDTQYDPMSVAYDGFSDDVDDTEGLPF